MQGPWPQATIHRPRRIRVTRPSASLDRGSASASPAPGRTSGSIARRTPIATPPGARAAAWPAGSPSARGVRAPVCLTQAVDEAPCPSRRHPARRV